MEGVVLVELLKGRYEKDEVYVDWLAEEAPDNIGYKSCLPHKRKCE